MFFIALIRELPQFLVMILKYETLGYANELTVEYHEVS